MPKARSKSQAVEEMAWEREEETPLHGAINEEEAKLYIQSVDNIFNDMARNIKEGVENAMEPAILALKQAMEKVIPGMQKKWIPDPSYKLFGTPPASLCENKWKRWRLNWRNWCQMRTSQGVKISYRTSVKLEELTEQQRQDISEVFKNLEVTHEHLAKSWWFNGSIFIVTIIQTAASIDEGQHLASGTDQYTGEGS